MIERLRRAILRLIPGSAPNIAARKRSLQRRLQEAGYSRAQALAEVARRFRGPA